MSSALDLNLDEFLIELFQSVRKAGMVLTLDEYDLLRQALAKGYGLGGWEDLKRICQLLWVKPSFNRDAKAFQQGFNQFRQRHQVELPVLEPIKHKAKPPISAQLPQVPPRKWPAREAKGEALAPVAVKTLFPAMPLSPSGKKTGFRLQPQDFPIDLYDVQCNWRSLRKFGRWGREEDLDLEATIRRIEQEGFFSDVVLRPVRTKGAELILLVDDSNVMIPFRPALQPFVQAIAEQRITPAQLYQFTVYPDDFLYNWSRPSQAIPLGNLLSRWHRDRTIVLIWSDAGAASSSSSQEYIEGMTQFLVRLTPCIRQLVWINPLPLDRWHNTTAQAIATQLNGQMIPLTPVDLRSVLRQHPSETLLKL
jgi:uncharacterized protein with von Willebrand factor type A (vWA) domain